MKQFLLLTSFSFLVINAFAQPATEVVLFDLVHSGENLIATNGSNISAHKGYDNQPFFHPDKNVLYYTSADDAGRTDIKQYDFIIGTTTSLTSTPEREYSPTVTPDNQYVSCIIQRDNGAQDLGKVPVNGGSASAIVDHLVVGYHAWLNGNTLYLFVLGEPATLRRYTVATGRDTILATNIGRSLHRMPGTPAVSFVQKSNDSPWALNRIDESGGISKICDTLPGREDLAWMSDGWLLMSDGRALFICQAGKTKWKEIKLTSAFPLKNISRMAVNASGTKLALVTEE
ncbi:MAG TPA: hypothetical protein VK658_02700 [Chryseolinea sp.]|nr:hypothetical protein [Chryseolinea sp.]